MSGGTVCKCDKKNWAVTDRNANHSAFNGYHRTYSAYSGVICTKCFANWRSKANYINYLPDMGALV